ncbi:nucleotidyltransferase family protein [Agathobacter rectalis]|uniref:nucleotidyltransferase family protein n=1 Tax=Agathobacter rectalis TaxID=39491 RepID=UPI0027D24174|nr:nucleotidyltransferase family protein [Agathobacter rectalis]MCB7111157.1 nucleotidyltransferase family protein [Agathobacter rectalis]MCG4814286.1 nucleotidyltransferase family protein [Agathobacter rectalis]
MIHIIYMAAGNSRRFGSNKLFYELNGKPMYRHLLDHLIEIKDRYNKLKNTGTNKPLDSDEMDADTVIDTYIGTDTGLSKKPGKKTKNAESNNPVIDITVVTRYREILDYCACILDCHAVLSPDSEKGISYTIKAGIMAVQEQKKTGMQDYYMFAVADQPYLKSQSVIKLIDKVLENKGNKRLVFSLRCGDAVGNPCVFHSSLIPQLLSLEGDKGGRSVAKKYDCVYVDIADERELMDIDTLSDSKHTVTL